MELFLIRHGQSANNANPISQRVDDPTLTTTGHEQARCVGRWCQGLDLGRLLTSPFRRTLETTQHIHQVTGLTPEVWVDLHEHGGCICGTDAGSFQGRPGMTRAEIQTEYAEYLLPDEIDGQGWWKNKPYETTEQVQKRAVQVAQKTIDQFAHNTERLALVSHGGFLPLLIGALLNHGTSGYDWLGSMPNTAVTKLYVEPGKARLLFYNSIFHLPGELIT